MTYGWAGTILRVDLTNGSIEREPIEGYAEEFLGGKGINTKILWDEVTPDIEPFDPENLLIFGAGTLAGTVVHASCRCNVTSKSPQTGIFGDASFGGYFAPELKFAGIDHIVFCGKSERPVYLRIDDQKVELRSAGVLWGKDTIKTEEMIKDELGDRDIQVACIGPAGENEVVSASINHGLGNVAARTGMGAVMGSKKLKAIAVRGTGNLNVARPLELNELCAKIVAGIPLASQRRGMFHRSFEPGDVVFGNHDQTPVPEFQRDFIRLQEEYFKKYKVKDITCFNCAQACKHLILCPDIDGAIVLKCENKSEWLARSKKLDYGFTAKATLQCHKYGLDLMSTTAQVAFLMDLFDKGIITEKDTDGIRMEWKNLDAMYDMIQKIAMREGCGELFADGIVSAAKKIGNGADQYAYTTKGLEPPQFSHYRVDLALGAAISERGDSLRTTSAAVSLTLNSLPNVLPEKAIDGMIKRNFPPKFWEIMHDKFGYKGKGTLLAYHERVSAHIPDILGLCKFIAGWMPFNYFLIDEMAELTSHVTGMDIDKKTLNTYSYRMSNLTRAFNLREGITRKDDTVPDILFKEPSLQTGEPLDRNKFDKIVDEFYSDYGWDENGIPTRKRLEELGLKYVADDLEKRKIIPNRPL